MKIKRHSPQRLPRVSGFKSSKSSLGSQAYRFFWERLRSRGKVRHLRGLRGGIRSLFRAELALRRFLATFRGPVSAAHFGISGRLSSRESETGFNPPGDGFVVATRRFHQLARRQAAAIALRKRTPVFAVYVCRMCRLIQAAQLMPRFCSCSAQLCGRARARDVTVRSIGAVPFAITSTIRGDK